MATKRNGQSGGMSGKLGSKIMYSWKGKPCERAYTIPKDPMTPAQLAHRRLFGTVSSLGAAMRDIVKIGFRSIADERHTTEKNVFVRFNKSCVSLVDDEVRIDYASLKVADGPLKTVDFDEPTTADGRVLRVTFSDHSHANRYNYVIVAAYVPQEHNSMRSEPVFRSSGVVEITLPESWTGLEAHLYGFCWDGASQVSPSCYVGVLNNA